MRTPSRFTTVLVTFAALSFASTPVATVSSSQPFTMAGHAVTSPGISSWPVVVGDEIATADGPAVLNFPDGSSVKLAAGSSARVGGSVAEPKVVLMSGTLDYKLAAGSKLTISNSALKQHIKQPAVQSGAGAAKRTWTGTLSSPVFWVPASFVAGGGAGAGIANALITGLPPVSNFQ